MLRSAQVGIAVICVIMWASDSYAQATDPILFKYSGAIIFDGEFGPVRRAQEAAQKALEQCGTNAKVNADGRFGSGTRSALVALAKCPDFSTLGADARDGALTEAYWRKLTASAPPGVDARARAIKLTFENTDYTRAEWNFCQNKPFYEPKKGQAVCYSNDRKSYLTWGPNGATAGHGREIQTILAAINGSSPKLIEVAFGEEAPAVHKMLTLKDGDSQRSLETFLCGIWDNRGRREAWRQGFFRLGRETAVQDIYDSIYRSASFDGGKIAGYYAVYASFSRNPTEVDHAFFKDRAAHLSFNAEKLKNAMGELPGISTASAWRVRQLIGEKLPAPNPNQEASRLGRDVAFYIDGLGETKLTSPERAAWQAVGRLRASSVGLSDDRFAPAYSAGPVHKAPDTTDTVSSDEALLCPKAILDTVAPPK